MMTLDEITKKVLEQIDASGFKQSGAFNLRHNGIALCHGDSEHIKIKKKQDKPGIDIYIDGKTDGARGRSRPTEKVTARICVRVAGDGKRTTHFRSACHRT